jgi:hypothetical protein
MGHLLETDAGAVQALEIVAFLRAQRRHLGDRKLLIICDRLQAHHSRLVREYVESQEGSIRRSPLGALEAHEMANFCPKTSPN